MARVAGRTVAKIRRPRNGRRDNAGIAGMAPSRIEWQLKVRPEVRRIAVPLCGKYGK